LKEYIERAAAIERFTVAEKEADCPEADFPVINKILAAIPVADVVKVVRCDCCERRYEEDGEYFCGRTDMPCADDDFCSYGERKDGDGNG